MAAAVPRTSEHRRTWAERFAIGAAIAAAVICFAVAGSLVAGYLVLQQREVVDITNPAQAPHRRGRGRAHRAVDDAG